MKTRVPATAGQTLLIIDDEPEICTALATALNERGRHTIVCRDAEAAQFVIERFPITHVLTDIRLTGPFRFEGLDIIDQVAPTATWEREILRAFQTWLAQVNVDVGVTADGGQPLGTLGAVQSDTRFGDIRRTRWVLNRN